MAATYMGQIVKGLHLHDMGLAHHDVSLENDVMMLKMRLLLTLDGGQGSSHLHGLLGRGPRPIECWKIVSRRAVGPEAGLAR